jgi:hypothetical protein
VGSLAFRFVPAHVKAGIVAVKSRTQSGDTWRPSVEGRCLSRSKQRTDTKRDEDRNTDVKFEGGRSGSFTEYKYELRVESDAGRVEKGRQRGESV